MLWIVSLGGLLVMMGQQDGSEALFYYLFLQGKLEVAMIGMPDFPKQRVMTLLKDLEQQFSLLIAECQRNGRYAHNAPPYIPTRR